MSGWLSGRYTQERPYKVYIVGPDERTSGQLFTGVRHHLGSLSNTSGDQLQGLGANDPEHGISNEFTVIRQPRQDSDATLRYTVINDPAPVVATGPVAKLFTDPIDAFVVTFRVDQADDFEALYRSYVDLVVKLCQRQYKPGAPQKVIVLVANRTRVFSQDQAFRADDMRALMRRTHSAYLCGNFNNSGNCASLMDTVVGEIVAVHRENHRRQMQAASSGSMSRASSDDGSSLLNYAWNGVSALQTRLFPQCVPTQWQLDDTDEQPAMSDEDRAYHSPLGMSDFTPIGQVITRQAQ